MQVNRVNLNDLSRNSSASPDNKKKNGELGIL